MRAIVLLLGVLAACGPTRTPRAPRADAVRLVPQFGHHGDATLTVSHDGRYLVSAGDRARVWDLETGIILRTLANPGERYIELARFTGRGYEVALADSEHVTVVDALSGEVKSTVRVASENHRKAISHDGAWLATYHDDRLDVWDVPRGARVVRHDLATVAYCAAFSPDKKLLAYGTRRAGVTVLGGTTRTQLQHFQTAIRALVFSDDGAYLVGFPEDDGSNAPADLADYVRYRERLRPLPGVMVWNVATGTGMRLGDRPVNAAAFLDGDRLVLADDRAMTVWSRATGKLVATIAEGATGLVRLDGERVVAATFDSDVTRIAIWNTRTATVIARHAASVPDPVLSVAFSPDSKRLVIGGDRRLNVWDLTTLRVENTLVESGVTQLGFLGSRLAAWVETESGPPPRFSPGQLRTRYIGYLTRFAGSTSEPVDESRTWTLERARFGRSLETMYARVTVRGGLVEQLTRFDTKTGEPTGSLPEPSASFADEVSGDRVLVTTGSGSTSRLEVWDFASQQMILAFEPVAGTYRVVRVAPDGKRAVASVEERTQVWDLSTGKLQRTLDGRATAAAFVSSELAILAFEDGSVSLWDLTTGSRRWTKSVHGDRVADVVVSGDRRLAATTSADGSARLWRVDNGSSIALSSFGDSWIVYDEHGYFDASRDGGSVVAAVEGRRGYKIDQLAVRNNRPDRLLESMQLGDAATIAHFRMRHERRVAASGLDTTRLAAAFADTPTVTIAETRTAGRTTTITFDVVATTELRSYTIWVNGVPVIKHRDVAIAGTRARRVESLELLPGDNRIEIGATAKNGAQSLRAYRSVQVAGTTRGDLYYVGFGVSRYRDPRYDLAYAHKDVLDLAAVLRKGTTFANVHVQTYTDAEVTPDAIRRAKTALANAKLDDTVVVFVAGHGIHARDAIGGYYFATHGVDSDDLARTAAPFELIEDLVTDIEPRRKLLLLDTCESGELDPDDERAVQQRANARGLRSRALVTVTRPSSRTIAAQRALRDRERYIYLELGRRAGVVVMASSRGSEASYELSSLRNGAFTHSILRALTGMQPDADRDNDGHLSTVELADAVAKEVPGLTDDLQHPTVDRDNRNVVITLPIVRVAPP